jgi:hypothetical protein
VGLTVRRQTDLKLMRKEYDFSRGSRNRFAQRARAGRTLRRSGGMSLRRDNWDDEPLTPAQIRKLKRRVANLDDPIRYLLVSQLGPRFALYYNVSDDVYALNDPRGGTLFKRRNAALAVKRLLGSRIRVVRCTTRREKRVRVPVLRERARRHKARRK